MSNTDVKGVLRGTCSVPECDCKEFRKLTDGRLHCAVCTHPPGRHHKLESVENGCQPNTERFDQASQNSATSEDISTSGVPRVLCRRGSCSSPAFYDNYGQFQYCSIQCRDKDLQREDTLSRLDKDIEEQTRWLLNHLLTQPQKPDSSYVKHCMQKMPRQHLGVLVCRDTTAGKLMVTGVVKRSPAYQHLKDGNLKLLSAITSVCGTEVGELKESFDDHVLPRTSVELGLDTSRALSVDSLPDWTDESVTHIFALHTDILSKRDFGLRLTDHSMDVEVEHVVEGSIAQHSGVCPHDIIVDASATKWKPRTLNCSGILQFLDEAYFCNVPVVLFVRRK